MLEESKRVSTRDHVSRFGTQSKECRSDRIVEGQELAWMQYHSFDMSDR